MSNEKDRFDLVFPSLGIAFMILMLIAAGTYVLVGAFAALNLVIGGGLVWMFCLMGICVYGMLTGRM